MWGTWLRGVSVAVIVAVFVSAPGRAQQPSSSVPDTPAGEALTAWLAAFNTGAAPTIVAFDKTRRANPPSMYQHMFLRAATGGLTVLRVEKSEPRSITVLAQEGNSEQLDRIELVVNEESPTRIVKLDVQPARRPPDLAIPRLTEAAALTALSDRADQEAKSDRFSGVLLVARNAKILLERTWGFADRAAKIDVTPDTRFNLASVVKMFTAVATLQLVESGKLRLDDTIGRHIPDYANNELASKATIRQLLTHTGGTGDAAGSEVSANRLALKEHADYVRALGSRPPVYEPGTDYQYSNHGYLLLGAIVERVSGLSYYDYVQRRIFDPAGMHSTDWLPHRDPAPNRARGYTRRDGQLVSNIDTLWWRGFANGSAYATAADLLRFAQALESGTLISKAMLAEATSPKTRRYGYGFITRDEGTLRNYGHGGTEAGANADVRIFPQLGYVVIGLSNFDSPAAGRLVDFFVNRMPI